MPRNPLRAVLALATALCLGAGVTAAGAATERGSSDTARYIVRLADAPLATYAGGVDGLAATTPAA